MDPKNVKSFEICMDSKKAMRHVNFDKTKAWGKLQKLADKGKSFDFKTVLTPERVKSFKVPFAEGLGFNYAAKAVDKPV